MIPNIYANFMMLHRKSKRLEVACVETLKHGGLGLTSRAFQNWFSVGCPKILRLFEAFIYVSFWKIEGALPSIALFDALFSSHGI